MSYNLSLIQIISKSKDFRIPLDAINSLDHSLSVRTRLDKDLTEQHYSFPEEDCFVFVG